jgi:hypothetical protein
MMSEILELLGAYNVTFQDSAKIYVDRSGVPVIRTLKHHLGDKPDYYLQLQIWMEGSQLDEGHSRFIWQ